MANGRVRVALFGWLQRVGNGTDGETAVPQKHGYGGALMENYFCWRTAVSVLRCLWRGMVEVTAVLFMISQPGLCTSLDEVALKLG